MYSAEWGSWGGDVDNSCFRTKRKSSTVNPSPPPSRRSWRRHSCRCSRFLRSCGQDERSSISIPPPPPKREREGPNVVKALNPFQEIARRLQGSIDFGDVQLLKPWLAQLSSISLELSNSCSWQKVRSPSHHEFMRVSSIW